MTEKDANLRCRLQNKGVLKLFFLLDEKLRKQKSEASRSCISIMQHDANVTEHRKSLSKWNQILTLTNFLLKKALKKSNDIYFGKSWKYSLSENDMSLIVLLFKGTSMKHCWVCEMYCNIFYLCSLSCQSCKFKNFIQRGELFMWTKQIASPTTKQ